VLINPSDLEPVNLVTRTHLHATIRLVMGPICMPNFVTIFDFKVQSVCWFSVEWLQWLCIYRMQFLRTGFCLMKTFGCIGTIFDRFEGWIVVCWHSEVLVSSNRHLHIVFYIYLDNWNLLYLNCTMKSLVIIPNLQFLYRGLFESLLPGLSGKRDMLLGFLPMFTYRTVDKCSG
jgi:hypothetical protein